MNRVIQRLQAHVGIALAMLIGAAAIQGAAAQAAKAPEAAIQAARQMLTLQDYAGALNKLNTVLEEHPDKGEARFLKALALAHSGKTQAALALFEDLVRDYPKMTEAWNNLGVLRARSGNLVGARKALERAAELDPGHVAARQNLGDVYVALAHQAYLDASALAPDNRVLQTKTRKLAGFMLGSPVADDGQSVATQSGDSTAAPESTPERTRIASVGVANVVTPPAAPTTSTTQTADADTGVDRPAKKAVRAALQDWAEAWSAQNVEAYFAAYSDQFDPQGTRTVGQWRQLRMRRVSNPEWISIQLSNIEVNLVDDDTAVVCFEQDYESESYQDHVRKTVTMARGAHGWLITTES